jgi:hypothetical protein
MGGRGSSGGSGGGGNSPFGKEKPLTVETRYIEPSYSRRGTTRGRWDDTVLQAVDKGNGEVALVYATADKYEKTAKTNATNYVTFTLDHGFVNENPHNINFENITAFTGQTYGVKETLKQQGFKWKNGKWSK